MSPPLDFLKQFRPNGPWVLTAVPVEGGKLDTATFETGDKKKIESWLKTNGKDHNIYFSVNPTIEAVTKKASRQDIASVEYLHVDVDPRAGENGQAVALHARPDLVHSDHRRTGRQRRDQADEQCEQTRQGGPG